MPISNGPKLESRSMQRSREMLRIIDEKHGDFDPMFLLEPP